MLHSYIQTQNEKRLCQMFTLIAWSYIWVILIENNYCEDEYYFFITIRIPPYFFSSNSVSILSLCIVIYKDVSWSWVYEYKQIIDF